MCVFLIPGDYIFYIDFDWSIGNDVIVSASSDGTYRLWNTNTGDCLRVISDTSGSQANCCCFHSQNGNFLIVSVNFGIGKVQCIACASIHVHYNM